MNRTKSCLLAVLTTSLVSIGACGADDETSTVDAPTSLGPKMTDATTTTTAPTEPGRAWRTVEVVDPDRGTDEVVNADGEVVLDAADTRTIPVELIYEGIDGGGEDAAPSDTAPRPLVVWMNGLGGRAAPEDPLLVALYEAGYIVAAPNSPEVSAPASSPADFPELPADVRVVVDAILHPADGVADDLAANVVSSEIGLAGHSIGSSAVLASAFHDCCRDPRVGAAVAIGANTGFRFGDTDFDYSGTPLLLVNGDADQISPLAESEKILAASSDPTRLLVVPGADHFEPVYGGADTDAGSLTIDAIVGFLDVHLAGRQDVGFLADFAATLPAGSWRTPAA